MVLVCPQMMRWRGVIYAMTVKTLGLLMRQDKTGIVSAEHRIMREIMIGENLKRLMTLVTHLMRQILIRQRNGWIHWLKEEDLRKMKTMKTMNQGPKFPNLKSTRETVA